MNGWKGVVGDALSAAYAMTPRPARSGCRVLMYHAIGSAAVGDARNLYSLNPQDFATQVGELASASGAVSLEQGVRDGQGIVITFDDGYRDNLATAAPLLVDARLPFTVFVVPAFVTSGERDYLSVADLRELARLPGATIGAHGYSHRPLTQCDDAALSDELAESRRWLEDLLGIAVTAMSYPHGAVDARVRDAAARAGYRLAASSRFGVYRAGDDPLWIPRTDIWAMDGIGRFRAKLAGHWDWMAWRN